MRTRPIGSLLILPVWYIEVSNLMKSNKILQTKSKSSLEGGVLLVD